MDHITSVYESGGTVIIESMDEDGAAITLTLDSEAAALLADKLQTIEEGQE